MTGPHVQVIASGAAVEPVAECTCDLVICADGGLAVALGAGRGVDVIVGDLDSAREHDLRAAESARARIERHAIDKDESDLELAMTAAIGHGAGRITAHLADGGRLDHQLANLLVLASSRWRGALVDAWVGHDRVWVVRDELALMLEPGAGVAIQAVAGPARVSTAGLAFPLVDEELIPTQARGIANVVESVPAKVTVRDGVVLVIATDRQSAQAT